MTLLPSMTRWEWKERPSGERKERSVDMDCCRALWPAWVATQEEASSASRRRERLVKPSKARPRVGWTEVEEVGKGGGEEEEEN